MPVLNTSHNRIYIPRSTTFGTPKPLDLERKQRSNEISWTKLEKLNEKDAKK